MLDSNGRSILVHKYICIKARWRIKSLSSPLPILDALRDDRRATELNSREKLHLRPNRLCQSECSPSRCPGALYKLAAATGIKTIETYCTDEIYFHTGYSSSSRDDENTIKKKRGWEGQSCTRAEGRDFRFHSVVILALLLFFGSDLILYCGQYSSAAVNASIVRMVTRVCFVAQRGTCLVPVSRRQSRCSYCTPTR